MGCSLSCLFLVFSSNFSFPSLFLSWFALLSLEATTFSAHVKSIGSRSPTAVIKFHEKHARKLTRENKIIKIIEISKKEEKYLPRNVYIHVTTKVKILPTNQRRGIEGRRSSWQDLKARQRGPAQPRQCWDRDRQSIQEIRFYRCGKRPAGTKRQKKSVSGKTRL